MNGNTWGLILAAGAEQQIPPGVDVAFLALGDRPALGWTLAAFESCPDIHQVAVVAPDHRSGAVRAVAAHFGCGKLRAVVEESGGRAAQREAARKAMGAAVEWVVEYEASRIGVTAALISEVLRAAQAGGCATAARRIEDPVRLVKGRTPRALPCSGAEAHWEVFPPTAYRADVLRRLRAAKPARGAPKDDDWAALDRLKVDVRLVPAPGRCLRLRTAADLGLAAQILSA